MEKKEGDRAGLIVIGIIATGFICYLLMRVAIYLQMPPAVENHHGTRNSLEIFKIDVQSIGQLKDIDERMSSVDLTRLFGACDQAANRMKKYKANSTFYAPVSDVVNSLCAELHGQPRGTLSYRRVQEISNSVEAAWISSQEKREKLS